MDPSTAGKRRPATYEDLLRVPDHKIAEIIDGELVVSPRPAAPHALASSVMASDLLGAFGRRGRGGGSRPGGWWILFEPELHLGPDVLVPDLGGWRRERLPRMTDVPYFELPPDWVCEVVSPRSGRDDRVRKSRICAREGVGHMWLVDPRAQTLEVFRLHQDGWLRVSSHGGAEHARAEPFDAVELELREWWFEPDEDPEPHT